MKIYKAGHFVDGPWVMGSSDQKVTDLAVCHTSKNNENSTIARFSKSGFKNATELHETAKLVVAAPSMFNALQAMTTSFHDVEYIDEHKKFAMKMALNAIREATGEQP